MAKAIYLINPACDFPTYFGAEVYAANGFRPVTLMADLAVVTLAAMAPSDFEVRLCDENISPVDFDCALQKLLIFRGIDGHLGREANLPAVTPRIPIPQRR